MSQQLREVQGKSIPGRGNTAGGSFREEKENGAFGGKKKVVVFRETQGGKEAVVRDEDTETAGVGHGRQREGRRGTWREEKNGSNGGLVGVGGRKTPGDFPLQRNENHSHF